MSPLCVLGRSTASAREVACASTPTLIYVWTAHILINLGLVFYNIIVNLLGGNFFHLFPRAVLAFTAIYWYYWCWTNHTANPGCLTEGR